MFNKFVIIIACLILSYPSFAKESHKCSLYIEHGEMEGFGFVKTILSKKGFEVYDGSEFKSLNDLGPKFILAANWGWFGDLYGAFHGASYAEMALFFNQVTSTTLNRILVYEKDKSNGKIINMVAARKLAKELVREVPNCEAAYAEIDNLSR